MAKNSNYIPDLEGECVGRKYFLFKDTVQYQKLSVWEENYCVLQDTTQTTHLFGHNLIQGKENHISGKKPSMQAHSRHHPLGQPFPKAASQPPLPQSWGQRLMICRVSDNLPNPAASQAPCSAPPSLPPTLPGTSLQLQHTSPCQQLPAKECLSLLLLDRDLRSQEGKKKKKKKASWV